VLRLKGSPATSQPAFAAGHQARYPAGYTTTAGGGPAIWLAFPLPFGCRHSLPGRPVPAGELRFPHGRLTAASTCRGPRRGFHVPHASDTRRAGCPLYPGGNGVHTAIDETSAAACRLSRPASLSSRYPSPSREVAVTRHQQGFTGIHPPALPLTCDHWMEQQPLGFSLGSAPSRYQLRTPGRGPISNTDRESRFRHYPNLQSTYSLNACDLVSQLTSADPGIGRSWAMV
jgi:hypothetical protein